MSSSPNISERMQDMYKRQYSWVLFFCLLALVSSCQEVVAAPNPTFASIIQKLSSKTQVPLLLPGFIPESEGSQVYATVSGVKRSQYEINLAFTEDCNDATACRLGMMAGKVKPAGTPEGTSVVLAGSRKGYFVDATCGASCSDSTLTWDQSGYRYTVGIKAGKLDSLIKMANSMVSK